MKIFCNACIEEREADLALGQDLLPHKKDLATSLFWVCKECKNYVGCHPNSIKPLGRIGQTRIFCSKCVRKSVVRLTLGIEVYPDRQDLYSKYFWICTKCSNFVGCHPNTVKPLGNIGTPKLRRARAEIHEVLDKIWQSGTITRFNLYKELSDKLGWQYHTAKIRSVGEAKQVMDILNTYEITMPEIDGDFV